MHNTMNLCTTLDVMRLLLRTLVVVVVVLCRAHSTAQAAEYHLPCGDGTALHRIQSPGTYVLSCDDVASSASSSGGTAPVILVEGCGTELSSSASSIDGSGAASLRNVTIVLLSPFAGVEVEDNASFAPCNCRDGCRRWAARIFLLGHHIE